MLSVKKKEKKKIILILHLLDSGLSATLEHTALEIRKVKVKERLININNQPEVTT